MTSAKAAVDYLSHVDYLSTTPGDLIGRGFDHLDISGKTPRDVMECLAHNLDPATGQVLRPKAKDGDRVGVDFTFTCPKSVSIVREILDPRIEGAHREAVTHTMGCIEADMQSRVRVGKADHDRVTGNLMAYRVTHRDSRINPDDQRPDPHLHDHVFILNLTHDSVEEKFKAAQIGQIKHDANYFEAIYHNRLAANLRQLGYGVRREGKAFEIAGVERPLIEKFSRRHKYIKSVIDEFGITDPERLHNMGATTRLGKAKDTAENLRPYYVSRLTDAEKQQLRTVHGRTGFVTTDEKAVEFAIGHVFERKSVEEERKLYEVALRQGVGSVTPEGVMASALRQGALLKDRQVTTKAVLAEEDRIVDFARAGKGVCSPLGAGTGLGESPNNTRILAGMQPDVGSGPDVSGQRTGERVERPQQASPLYPSRAAAARSETATPAALGQQKGRPDESGRPLSARPGNQFGAGAPLKSGRDEKRPLIRDAGSAGRSLGAFPPDRAKTQPDPATLSPEQQAKGTAQVQSSSKLNLSPEQAALVNHILASTDRMILVVGDAGTGKTRSVREAFDRIHCPVEMLAPSADASRGVLRAEGFDKADTVASFLLSEKRQQAVRNGVLWIDEAGLLPIRDLSKLTDIARQQNARIILQGDPKQHASVARHGNMLNVLQEYAGLPVGRLQTIRRQQDKAYRVIVADIAAGKREKALDNLIGLDWVQQVESNTPLVDDYMAALAAKKTALVVAPTHAEGDEITAEIRARLKQTPVMKGGKAVTQKNEAEEEVPVMQLDAEDHAVKQLVPLNWTNAEKGDRDRFTGDETLVFHRNSGTFKAGQVARIAEWKPSNHYKSPEHFSVYREGTLPVAAGDTIRITANGKSADGHKLNNGAVYKVASVGKKGIKLDNGWLLPPDFRHLAHGYVSTSHASQGKTVDRVFVAMGSESRGAISAEQFYVSLSRGKQLAKVYTDMPPEELKRHVGRTDTRRSATELMRPRRSRLRKWLSNARDRFKVLQAGIVGATKVLEQRKERERGGYER